MLGRSGTFSTTIPELLDKEAAVTTQRCDISRVEDVDGAASPPISQLFHAGGLLQDGILMKQTAAGIRAVLAPKLGFLEHAAALLSAHPLRQINLFSSVSAFLGSPGQANYAAANMALNQMAQQMQQQGLVGSSIGWGAWAEVGMAQGNTAVLSRVEKSGLGIVHPTSGLQGLEAVLHQCSRGLLVHAIASPFNFSQLLQGLPEPPKVFSAVLGAGQDDSAAINVSTTLPGAALDPISQPAAVVDVESITERISQIVAELLGTDVAPDQPLMEAGMDSLAAVELRNELGSRFNISMPATVMFDYPSAGALAGFVAARSQPAVVQGPIAQQAQQAIALAGGSGESRTAIAVYGLSCRYPHSVHSLDSFFEVAATAADLPVQTPYSRWDIDRLYSPSTAGNGAIYARFGAYLSGIDYFDAQLFNLPKAEALATDPQQRLLLEETHLALLNSQHGLGGLQGTNAGEYLEIS